MNELFSKIEDFLFDILGLVLPGMVFVIILMVPLLFLNDHSSTLIQPTPIIAIYNFIFVMKEKIKIQSGLSLIVFFITCYLVGHFVKVFAIIMYDFLSVIFDKILNPILNSIVTIPGKLFKWIYQKRYKTDIKLSKKYNYLLQIISPFRNTALKIFIFRPPDYFSDNSGLVTECVRIVNERLGSSYKQEWGYSFYKFASIMTKQNQIKSLAGNFLAKYNLYRSLAFIFIFSAFFYLFISKTSNNSFSSEFKDGIFYAIVFFGLLGFTFHYKYKRYWTLCGNETLVSLYCLLNKEKINNASR